MSDGLFGVSATKLSEPQGSGANVISPATAPSGLDVLARGIAEGVSIFGQFQKANAKSKDEETLSNYTKELTNIANARSAGSVGEREANVRATELYQRYSGSVAPHLVEELSKRRRAVFEGSSLSEVEQQVKLDQDLRAEALKRVQANGGIITRSMTPQQIDLLIEADAARIREQNNFRTYREKQEEARAEGRYNAEVDKRNTETMAADSITNIAKTQLPAFNAMMDGLIAEVDAGRLDWKTANLQRNAVMGSLQLQIKEASKMNPALASNWEEVFKRSDELYAKLMNPETRASVSKSQLQELQNQALLLTWSKSEKARQAYVLGYFAPASMENLTGIPGTASDIVGILSSSNGLQGERVPQVIGDKTNSKPVMDTVTKNMKNTFNMADGDPAKAKATEGMRNQVNNVLLDIYQQGSNEFKPISSADLNDAANMIASTEFGKMVSEGMVDSRAIGAAQRVLAIKYNAPVLNQVGATLDEIASQIKDVDVKFVDGRLLVSGKTDTTRSPVQQDAARQTAATLSQAIEKVVRMNANLLGQTDYQKYWEANRHLLVPTLYQTPDLKIGTQKQGKDGATYEYIGGAELNKSSWRKVKQ